VTMNMIVRYHDPKASCARDRRSSPSMSSQCLTPPMIHRLLLKSSFSLVTAFFHFHTIVAVASLGARTDAY